MTSAPATTIVVLVADGQRLAAEALIGGLKTCARIHPIPEAAFSGGDAVDVARRWKPDVVLLDYWIPGAVDALAATTAIRRMESEYGSAPRVLLLSPMIGAQLVEAALSAGASGFLPRSLGLEEVAEGVRRAQGGESPVFADSLRRAVQETERRVVGHEELHSRLLTLSQREFEVLRAVAEGRSIHDVAAELFLSAGTVRNHVHSVLKKTGARSQREAVRLAREARILPPASAKESQEHRAEPAAVDE